jgi:hypothetical protein
MIYEMMGVVTTFKTEKMTYSWVITKKFQLSGWWWVGHHQKFQLNGWSSLKFFINWAVITENFNRVGGRH